MEKECLEEIKMIRLIDGLRNYMHILINKSRNLTDPDVILISQLLDFKLNEYNEYFNNIKY